MTMKKFKKVTQSNAINFIIIYKINTNMIYNNIYNNNIYNNNIYNNNNNK